MQIVFPFDVEVRAKASSVYTLETIERRLAQLADRDDEEARREREYLEALKARQQQA